MEHNSMARPARSNLSVGLTDQRFKISLSVHVTVMVVDAAGNLSECWVNTFWILFWVAVTCYQNAKMVVALRIYMLWEHNLFVYFGGFSPQAKG